MLKGAIDKETTDIVIDEIKNNCEVLWINEQNILDVSAKISHGNGIPAVDSLIPASLLDMHVETVYTTDSHITNYQKKGLSIIKL